jgi:hypothetical protein
LQLNPSTWTAVGPAPVDNGQLAANLGTAPVSGRITGIAADPSNASTIYVAAAGGGVWKTTDGGGTWVPLTDNLADAGGNPLPLFMGSIAVDPLQPNILYAGTGEANNAIDSFYGRGILKSTDGGQHWTLLDDGGTFERKTIARIVVDPRQDLNVYAAVDDGGINGTKGNTGIYKSTDGGQSWSPTTTAISTTEEYSDLVIDPNVPSTLYLAVGSHRGSAHNGVYQSTDAGTSWKLLSAANLPAGTTDGRIALALAPDSQALYVSIANPSNGNPAEGRLFKLLKVTDGGTRVADLTAAIPNSDYLGEQGWYDTALAVQPGNPDVVFASGDSSFKVGNATVHVPDVIESTDGGATWTDLTFDGSTGPHSDSHALAFDAAGKLLEGDDGGIFRLDNPVPGRFRWADLNGNLQITQFYGLALDPTNPDLAYGGSQDNGSERFDGALGWTRVLAGDGGFTHVDPFQPATVYEEVDGALQRSDHGGDLPRALAEPIGNAARFIPPYVLDTSTPKRVLLGTDVLNESLDQGATWRPIGRPNVNGFNPSDKPADASPIDAIAVAPDDPRTVYVAAGGHLFVSHNSTSQADTAWAPIDIPGSNDSIAALVVDPSDASTAYAVRNRFTPQGTSGGRVFATTNGGLSWTDVSGNLPNVPAWSVALDPRGTSTSRVLYVGTDVGVYASSDAGRTWAPYGSGLPNAQVRDLEIAPQTGILAAATHGRGVYEIDLAGPADLSHSAVAVSAAQIEVLGATTVTLTARDAAGRQETGGGLKQVAFSLGTGSAGGTLGPVTDNGDGTYTAVFTATSAGQDTFNAQVGGELVTSAAPTLTVTGTPFSLDQSGVSVSPAGIPAGGSATVTLTARDAAGNPEPGGGLTVTFALGGGSAIGTFGPVTDNRDGTYTAAFTGTTPGQDTITATLNGQPVTSAAPPITVTPGPPTLTPTLADWTVNQPGYSQQLAAGGGTGALAFGVSNGSLPAGLSLDASTGALVGTPSAADRFSFSITVSDSAGASTRAYTVTINPPLAFSTTMLPDWTVNLGGYHSGSPGLAQPLAGGGTGALTFRVSSGALPPGLSLASNVGAVSGTPTVAGTFPCTVTVTDAAGASAQQSYTVTINSPATVSPATLPDGQLGQPYGASITAAGGTGPNTFIVYRGSLPPGLSLDPDTGILHGTPTVPGGFTFDVNVIDAVGAVVPVGYTVNVSPPTSAVNPLPDTSPPQFTVSWAGTTSAGLGIAFYDVYVSDNHGPDTLWQAQTAATSATFIGQNFHTYAFYSIATDTNGGRQPFPAVYQATTTVLTPVPLPEVRVLRQKKTSRSVTFLLTNPDNAVDWPIYLVLTGVSRKVTITNGAGVSSVAAPGSPYFRVAGGLGRRAKVRVVVRFRTKGRGASFNALVFAGFGLL